MLSKLLALFRKESKPPIAQNIENIFIEMLEQKGFSYEMKVDEDKNVFFTLSTDLKFGKANIYFEVFKIKKCVRMCVTPQYRIPKSRIPFVTEFIHRMNLQYQLGNINFFDADGVFCYQISFIYQDQTIVTLELLCKYLEILFYYSEISYDDIVGVIFEKTETKEANHFIQKQTNPSLN